MIYHGTRHLPLVMRTGVLLPASAGDAAVFFSRSPEVAAYWGNMTGETRDLSDGGVLVLNRSTLVQNYRLLASRYLEDWNDEREEVVWGRRINIRRHLLGVVCEGYREPNNRCSRSQEDACRPRFRPVS